VLGVEPELKSHAHLGERRAAWDRHQVLPSNVTTAALDATLVGAFSGSAEPSLKGIVRGEGGEPWW
jgi:hypothetical protein